MSEHRVCPWWIGYLLACPLRRFSQDPQKILAPYVRAGMIVLEPGPGMGFFTLPLLRMVGEAGRVIAVDVQPKMIQALEKRARTQGLAERMETRLAQGGQMGIEDLRSAVDFVLAFAVVHELPSAESFFRQAAAAMKPGAGMLFAEPAGHVKAYEFDGSLSIAAKAGLAAAGRPEIRRSYGALLKKA